MEGKSFIDQENLRKRLLGVLNRNVAIFAFFLVLAFIFWYLNSLGKEIEAEIKFPVNYINLPKEKAISGDQQTMVNLAVKGTGYSILKVKFSSSTTPIIIDVSKFSYKRVPGSSKADYYLLTSGIPRTLTLFTRSGCEITSVKPDTLFFTLQNRDQEPGFEKDNNKVVGN